MLVVQDAYTPSLPSGAQQIAGLNASIARVFARTQRVKVAVIASRFDLGSVTALWAKPTLYAKFLGTELKPLYVGPLLIVMPHGFGIWDGGRSTAAEARVLAGLRPDRSSAVALVTSAASAVDKLLKAGALRSKDILAPSVYPQVVFAKAGETVSLSYSVIEDSERARDDVTVFAGTEQLAAFHFALRHVVFTQRHVVQWQVPDPAPDGLRYCVRSTDAAGNRGKEVCLPIKVS